MNKGLSPSRQMWNLRTQPSPTKASEWDLPPNLANTDHGARAELVLPIK